MKDTPMVIATADSAATTSRWLRVKGCLRLTELYQHYGRSHDVRSKNLNDVRGGGTAPEGVARNG